MTRIVYLLPAPAAATGGAKVSFRHVEALVRLGYDAVIRVGAEAQLPAWFDQAAPVERADTPLAADDILVFPEDAADLMAAMAGTPNRKLVFCQSPHGAAVYGLARLSAEARAHYRTFMASSLGLAVWIGAYLDHDFIGTVPAFADERLFVPAGKQRVIAVVPSKRPEELRVIRHLFDHIHPGATGWTWDLIAGRSEAETAVAMGRASVFLALPRMESLSMTVLEAMACGCLVAGFTGIGPRQYMTAMNGLWVEEDDCEAAAEALARACVLAEQDEAAAHLIRHAALTTAAQWSHARFVDALERFWREDMGVRPGL